MKVSEEEILRIASEKIVQICKDYNVQLVDSYYNAVVLLETKDGTKYTRIET